MKCLAVIAHPLPDSLCQHLAAQVTTHLRERGHDVITEDLYAQGFNPLLTAKERSGYYAQFTSDGAEEHIARLQDAEVLILVFPTWWFGLPAILKGWFDRVWAPGFAFDHSPGFGLVKPRLGKLRHVIVVTTLGSPWWVDRFVMFRPVRRQMKIAFLGACARQSRLTYLSLYKAEACRIERLEAFSRRLTQALDRIE